MRTVRWMLATAFVLAALSGCYIIFSFNPGPAVDLIASSTWIETGETSTLTANAYDPEGDTLSYEWYENGSLIVGETDSTLNYWRAVEETEYVTVKVVVRDGRGGYGTDSVDITVDPI
ncbi:MAG: hypothetical protein NTU62_09810, partial [Spirochaetes bacterium]|nr:hypothetical protein [Spirochaetota bacterium]